MFKYRIVLGICSEISLLGFDIARRARARPALVLFLVLPYFTILGAIDHCFFPNIHLTAFIVWNKNLESSEITMLQPAWATLYLRAMDDRSKLCLLSARGVRYNSGFQSDVSTAYPTQVSRSLSIGRRAITPATYPISNPEMNSKKTGLRGNPCFPGYRLLACLLPFYQPRS
jgi:hypothetical protein